VFNRQSEAGLSPPLPVTTPSTPVDPPRSFIAVGLEVKGNLVSQGHLTIEGQVTGDIKGSHVVVGEHATIIGSIIADEIEVHGHVMGSLRGKRVLLLANSHMEGDIFHTKLAIQQGAYFEGKSRRSENPIATGVSTDKTAPHLELPKSRRVEEVSTSETTD